MSLDAISPRGLVPPHGPNGQCMCRPERLAAQYQVQRLSPAAVLKLARIKDKADPHYLDSETIAFAIFHWHRIGLGQPLTDLWQILMDREKGTIAGMLSGSYYSHEQKKTLGDNIAMEIFTKIASGGYMWHCRFYYALKSHILGAGVKIQHQGDRERPTDNFNDFDESKFQDDRWAFDRSASGIKGVVDRVYLEHGYLSQFNDDQLLAVQLLARDYSYIEIAELMNISVQECNALIKRTREQAKRIRRAEAQEDLG